MRVLIAVVLGLLAAGCGGDRPLSTPLTFEMAGGDAFRADRLTVRPDGTVTVETLEGERDGRLTGAELVTLRDRVGDLHAAPAPGEPIPDGMSYAIDYDGRHVVAASGSVPEDLEPLLGTLVRLMDRHGP